jgi:hypothetical protein
MNPKEVYTLVEIMRRNGIADAVTRATIKEFMLKVALDAATEKANRLLAECRLADRVAKPIPRREPAA